jgi:thioredoxin 1
MAPILEELAAEYKGRVDVKVIDVYEQQEVARRYGVRLIPTQIFFDAQGKEVFRHLGFFPKEEIVAKFKELGLAK